MTIIKPKSYKAYLNFILCLFSLILVGGVFYIFEYNKFVGNRDLLNKTKILITKLQIENADLKNEIYETLSGPNLERLAKKTGMILDKKPDYLSINQWLSDSSH